MAVYVAMRVPLLQSQGLSAEVLTLLITRAVTYTVVGVVGGTLELDLDDAALHGVEIELDRARGSLLGRRHLEAQPVGSDADESTRVDPVRVTHLDEAAHVAPEVVARGQRTSDARRGHLEDVRGLAEEVAGVENAVDRPGGFGDGVERERGDDGRVVSDVDAADVGVHEDADDPALARWGHADVLDDEPQRR
jgi:hypothetical protein